MFNFFLNILCEIIWGVMCFVFFRLFNVKSHGASCVLFSLDYLM